MGSMTAIVIASALAMGWWDGEQGSGKIVEERREVGEFTGVRIGGGIQADVSIGSERKVLVSADDNLLPKVVTRVRDGVLEVHAKDVRPSKAIRLTVVTPKLDRVSASGGAKLRAQAAATKRFAVDGSGGADLDVTGLDAEELVIDLSGGVQGRIAGKAREAKLEFSGGVDLDAEGLEIETAELDASGGVKAKLAVSKSIRGDASGGVSVKVKGTPAVAVETSGGSSIRSGQ